MEDAPASLRRLASKGTGIDAIGFDLAEETTRRNADKAHDQASRIDLAGTARNRLSPDESCEIDQEDVRAQA